MNERGFSIIEVIVALLVFGTVTLCGLSFYSLGHNTFMRGREQTYALQIAHNKLSKVRLICPAKCAPFDDPNESPVIEVHYIPQVGLKYTSYLSWVQIDNPFGIPPADHTCVYDWYKIVTASVVWTSNIDKVERSLSLCTFGVKAPYHKD
jgi:prepilin-type N-terminal cleavage/methylation domain-containing protein